MNSGNPRGSTIVQDSLKKNRNHEHITKSDTALSPLELKRLYEYLFSSWNIYKLQFWVMVLISINLFLRGDETIVMGHFSIISHLTTYNDDGTISSLMLEIYGKIEKKTKKPVMLVLCTNDTHSWLCPMRFLMLFARIVGHRSGYLFTTNDMLEKVHMCTVGNSDVVDASKVNINVSMPYKTFMVDTVFYAKKILQREAILGLHVWRNTAYLMAQLGKGEPNEIRKSARHKSFQSYSRYEKDNATIMNLLQISSEHRETMSLVPKWKSSYVDNREHSSLVDSLFGRETEKDAKLLHHQANHFYLNVLKIESKNLSDLLEPALCYNSQKTPFKKIVNLLEPFNESVKKPLLDAIVEYKNEAVKKVLLKEGIESSICSSCRGIANEAITINEENDSALNIHSPNDATSAANDDACGIDAAKMQPDATSISEKPSRYDDLENRHHLKSLRGKDKINALIALNVEYEKCDKKFLTDKAKSFVRQALKPFVLCFEECCNSDQDAFLTFYDEKFNHSKFSCIHKTNKKVNKNKN